VRAHRQAHGPTTQFEVLQRWRQRRRHSTPSLEPWFDQAPQQSLVGWPGYGKAEVKAFFGLSTSAVAIVPEPRAVPFAANPNRYEKDPARQLISRTAGSPCVADRVAGHALLFTASIGSVVLLYAARIPWKQHFRRRISSSGESDLVKTTTTTLYDSARMQQAMFLTRFAGCQGV
jgi:hypothetical protein